MRAAPLVSLAFVVGLTIGPAAAKLDAHLETIFGQCRTQLELGETECSCVNERVTVEFEVIEVELIAARISANMVEVERLRETLLWPQRFAVFVEVTTIIEDCANGAPIANPL